MTNYEGIDKRVPVLANTEIKISNHLGSGGFCSVSAIRNISLQAEQSVNLNEEEKDARSRLAKQFRDYEHKYFSPQNIVVPGHTPTMDPLEQRPPRVALKRVKSNLPNERYKTGVKDLMAEIEILASCSHPHIIAIYAVGCDERDGDPEGRLASSILSKRRLSFAVIDQLRSTLRDKMHKWKEDRGFQFIKSRQSQQNLWLERLVVILNIADAIRYLHSKSIVHRDINPDNIGFADDQVVKLFDFGLAKVVEKDKSLTLIGQERGISWEEDDLFELTGTTGTLR
jgi:serine/threonine protein kinase